MKTVICSGYENCKDRATCPHSKPHIIHTIHKDTCFIHNKNYAVDDCDCINFNNIRKRSLNKLLKKINNI